jgi:hypothetical protein
MLTAIKARLGIVFVVALVAVAGLVLGCGAGPHRPMTPPAVTVSTLLAPPAGAYHVQLASPDAILAQRRLCLRRCLEVPRWSRLKCRLACFRRFGG